MPVEITEDWLDILDTTNYAPLKDPDNTYQSYRFKNLDIRREAFQMQTYEDI